MCTCLQCLTPSNAIQDMQRLKFEPAFNLEQSICSLRLTFRAVDSVHKLPPARARAPALLGCQAALHLAMFLRLLLAESGQVQPCYWNLSSFCVLLLRGLPAVTPWPCL